MKKIISLILSLSIIFSIFSIVPLNVSAETKAKSEENIYYSDLFYKYSHYLNDDYIDNYNTSCQGILYRVYEDYLNSPMYIFSDIKQALPAVFDLKEFTKAISDLTGLTNFSYEKALDRANQEFANELMGGCTYADKYSTQSEWFENINKFLKVYDTFEQNFTVYKKTEIEIYEETFQYFIDNSAFLHISITNIEMVKKIVLPKITEISDMLSVGADVLKGAKVMMLALMIEDMRACIIDDVLKYQSRNTTLYDGMTRLKKQLSDGFATYFCYNYLDNQVLKLVSENVQKKLLGNTVIGNPVFAIIGAIVDVACFVVFDVIFDVPDIDDLTTQAILSMYSNDFCSTLYNSRTKFYSQFSNDDIHTYETLFTAFQAATNAAFKASEKITLSSNRDDFNRIKSMWYRKSIYTNYINNVKETIKSIPMENREVTFYDWEITNTTYLRNPSEVIKADEIYFGDNFKVNIKLDGNYNKANLIIPSDEEIKIDGDIDVYDYAILDVYGKLTVNNLIVGYSNNVNNNNEIIVKNNLNASSSSAKITQSDDAKLYVGGSYKNHNTSHNIKGTIIFNGVTQQEIIGLNAYNIEVTNKEGIKYLTDCKVYGNYKLNGNPLDNNNKSTYIYDGISFDQISDYKKLVVENTLNLKSSVKGDITLDGNSYKANLIIPSDEEIKIDGDIDLDDYAILDVYGKLTVNNLIVGYSNNVNNNNEIIVKNNLNASSSSAKITQSDDAKLYVGGSYKNHNTSHNIKGTIIFNGVTQQEIIGLNAYNVEVTNKEGIKYLTDCKVYGNYKLNGNPLDNNNKSTYIYDGISFDQISDYKKLVVENTLNLKSSVKGDITLDGNSYKANLIIPSDEEIKIDGDIDVYDYAILDVYGKLTVNNLIVGYSNNVNNNNEIIVKNNLNASSSSAKITQSDDAKLYVGGSYKNHNTSHNIKGTIIFNGVTQQEIIGLNAYNVEVTNKEGIKYLTDCKVYGNYKLNGNPLDNNNKSTYIYDGISFDQISDYKKLVVENTLNLKSSVKGDITLDGNSYKANLIIPSDEEIKIDGDIDVYDYAILDVYGKLTVNNLIVGYSNNVNNNNEIIVKNNLNASSSSAKITQSDDAKLYVGGSFENNNTSYNIIGTIIFNGREKQNINGLSAEKIVLENESKEGVVFASAINPSILFDHKGNNFTLYNNGYNSNFVDYDADGLKDNLDPVPTFFNPFGDVDCDGVLNAGDLVSIRKILLNKDGMNTTQKLASDVNRDGKSDLRDLVRLKKTLAEKVN